MKQQSCKLGNAAMIVVFFGSALTASAGSLTPPTGPILPTNRVQINQQFSALPIVISEPGSYVLTGNIVAPPGHTDRGILIIGATDGVVLDLNGFSVIGVPGSTTGIRSFGTNVTIRNGIISGWGSSGVKFSSFPDNENLCENVKANNNLDGIVMAGGTVTGCTASNNTFWGILVSNESTVSHCTANENGSDGINAFEGPNTVIDCVANGNGRFGISIGSGSVIGNICYSNDDGNPATESGGIEIKDRALVQGNRMHGNEPYGIRAVSGTDHTIIKNVATGSSFNYSLVGGQDGVGPIGTAAASTSPWANITD